MAHDKEKVLEALKKIRDSPKRKFSQSVELIINLKELDIKKEEGKIEEYIQLPFGRGKDARVCAFVGPEMKDAAAKYCDAYVLSDDFDKQEKRAIRKLAQNNDFFIAQANVMPAVAKTFGRFLSPIGKMPSPKAGHVIPPKANMEPLIKLLRRSIKVAIKKTPVFQMLIGNEAMKDEELVQNITTIIEKVKARLPKGEHNIRNILLKTTMGKPQKVL